MDQYLRSLPDPEIPRQGSRVGGVEEARAPPLQPEPAGGRRVPHRVETDVPPPGQPVPSLGKQEKEREKPLPVQQAEDRQEAPGPVPGLRVGQNGQRLLPAHEPEGVDQGGEAVEVVGVDMGQHQAVQLPGVLTRPEQGLRRVSRSVHQQGPAPLPDKKGDVAARPRGDGAAGPEEDQFHPRQPFLFLRTGGSTESTASRMNAKAMGFLKNTR